MVLPTVGENIITTGNTNIYIPSFETYHTHNNCNTKLELANQYCILIRLSCDG